MAMFEIQSDRLRIYSQWRYKNFPLMHFLKLVTMTIWLYSLVITYLPSQMDGVTEKSSQDKPGKRSTCLKYCTLKITNSLKKQKALALQQYNVTLYIRHDGSLY